VLEFCHTTFTGAATGARAETVGRREREATEIARRAWEMGPRMSMFCLYVKPSPANAGTRLMSVTRLGPQWTGGRLRLTDPQRLGLRHGDIVGWSDFYSGVPADVHVARAAEGQRSGWLVWGGTLGLRSVPADLEDLSVVRSRWWDARPVLWVDDPAQFPEEVRAVVEPEPAPGAATPEVAVRG
jgi:hypothetical protein